MTWVLSVREISADSVTAVVVTLHTLRNNIGMGADGGDHGAQGTRSRTLLRPRVRATRVRGAGRAAPVLLVDGAPTARGEAEVKSCCKSPDRAGRPSGHGRDE